MTTWAPLAAAAALAAAPALAEDPAMGRAEALLPILNGAGDYAALFSPSFRAAVPEAKFREISAQLAAQFGKAERIESVVPATGKTVVVIGYERGRVTTDMVLDPAGGSPPPVAGLLVTGAEAREASLDEVVSALAGLPGATDFALAELGGAAPRMVASYQPDRPLAIGSSFKLVILAALVEEINAGKRRWSDPVVLDGRPLAGGQFTQAPAGTRVTLQELAAAMIAVSDNSAADLLLTTLGRARVEGLMARIGIAEPWRNQPFLSTLEAFKLKGVAGGSYGDRWATMDPKTKRALLQGQLAAIPNSAIDPQLFAQGPNRIGTVEWFATAADLLRVMDWLRQNTATGAAGATARAILSQNPGVGPGPAAGWRYLGYKGGSEPGVINMTFLLQSKAGRWFALSAGWNNAHAALDEGRFVALVSRALALAEAR